MRNYIKHIALMSFSLGILSFQSYVVADFNSNSNWQGNYNQSGSNFNAGNPESTNSNSYWQEDFNHSKTNFNPINHVNDGEFSERVYWQGSFNPSSHNPPTEPPLGANLPDHYDVIYRYNNDLNVFRDSTYMKYDEAAKRCEDLKKYRDIHECEIKWWYSKPYQYQPRMPG
jgi:hypothetical protein